MSFADPVVNAVVFQNIPGEDWFSFIGFDAGWGDGVCLNIPVSVSLLSGDRKPQIRFLGNHHSGSGNLYHKSFRM